jgi:hypothetical protein
MLAEKYYVVVGAHDKRAGAPIRSPGPITVID